VASLWGSALLVTQKNWHFLPHVPWLVKPHGLEHTGWWWCCVCLCVLSAIHTLMLTDDHAMLASLCCRLLPPLPRASSANMVLETSTCTHALYMYSQPSTQHSALHRCCTVHCTDLSVLPLVADCRLGRAWTVASQGTSAARLLRTWSS
jgi:hypothetical protein